MPCILKIRVLSARGLPVMDKSSGSSDAYVEFRLGELPPQRTEVCRKSLNPVWNVNFVLEVQDDRVLQDEMLEFKVWDYDVLQDDIIGSVSVCLSPLLHANPGSQGGLFPADIRGEFPLVDSVHGLRGELLVHIKVDFFTDFNPFKDTSAGVLFFSAPLPCGCVPTEMVGFVDALLVEEDPEYSIGDSFRAMRTSNDLRQGVLSSISVYTVSSSSYSLSIVLRLRRLVGAKALGLGAQAVLGYHVSFDIEGDRGIVGRATGSAVVIDVDLLASSGTVASPAQSSRRGIHHTPPSPMPHALERSYTLTARLRTVRLITMDQFPPDCVRRIGGLVSARAVKVLGKAKMKEKRDAYWREVRDDVRHHAEEAGFKFVAGYREAVTIRDDVAVFTGYGTACNLQLKEERKSGRPSVRRRSCACVHSVGTAHLNEGIEGEQRTPSVRGPKCRLCKSAPVPPVLLSSFEIPDGLNVATAGKYIEARVCRPKKKSSGETEAIIVSEAVPFVEIALYRQFIAKLSLYGLNAAFAIRLTISIGETMIAGTVSGTGVFVTALPNPRRLRISRGLETVGQDETTLAGIPRALMDLCDFYSAQVRTALKRRREPAEDDGDVSSSDEGEAPVENDIRPLLVSIDSEVDEDTLRVLYDHPLPHVASLVSTDELAGGVQLDVTSVPRNISVVYRVRWNEVAATHLNTQLASIIHMVHERLLSTFMPGGAAGDSRRVSVLKLCTEVSLPPKEERAVDVVVTAALLREDTGRTHQKRKGRKKDDLDIESPPDGPSPIFEMDGIGDDARPMNSFSSPQVRYPFGWLPSVLVSPLWHVPNLRIVGGCGRMEFVFIREQTGIRECGGIGGFMHIAMTHAMAVMRAHVAAIHANAVLGFEFKLLSLVANTSRDQAYALFMCSGDVAKVEV